jgi:hypothetical protein
LTRNIHTAWVRQVALSTNQRVYSALDEHGVVRSWTLPGASPELPDDLDAFLTRRFALELDAQGLPTTIPVERFDAMTRGKP